MCMYIGFIRIRAQVYTYIHTYIMCLCLCVSVCVRVRVCIAIFVDCDVPLDVRDCYWMSFIRKCEKVNIDLNLNIGVCIQLVN